MLTYNFSRIFRARGVERPFSYLKQAGFPDHLSSRINNNKVTKLTLGNMERLCLLLKCTPNDFFEWVPDHNGQVDKDHPILRIQRTEKIFDLTRTLNDVPLEKLDEIEQLIKEKVGKKDS